MDFPKNPNDLSNKYEYAVLLDSKTPIPEEEFNEKLPNPAKTYPFELDVFQKQAVIHIEQGENVFVAAHTSAGKTAIAEYAIALAFSHGTQVIYTSPIKALSNQKFRDLKKEFKDVGIITGDINLNGEAPCLVMTTEILLQMLYANSNTIDRLEFVIFDECHYVNDTKRGHVWEEVFILLPSYVKLVLLSATVPNVIQFSDWLGRTRQKKTFVVSTNKRPVPLKHYLYLGRDAKTQDQQILIVEGEGPINRINHEKAMDIMKERKNRRTLQYERSVYLNLIRHLQKSDKLPVICFTLSRYKCDQNLEMLLAIKEENISLTTKSESYQIGRFICKHLKHLKESDLKLEQVSKVSTMLKRGFGVHHSGILPILKELTEILFCSGFVKVLFATETFAMGVNMPARSVVFDSLNKFDGIVSRFLNSAEYIQMAGRAGRRGKDLDGTVIILCKYEAPSLFHCNLVMKGSVQYLESQFRLTYNMILNMLKSKSSSIENFLGSSYREYNKVLASSGIDNDINEICVKLKQLPQLICEKCNKDIGSWNDNFIQFKTVKASLMPKFMMRASDKKLLNSGRLLVFDDEIQLFRLGLLLKTVRGVNGCITELIILTSDNKTIEIKKVSILDVHCLLDKQLKGIDTNNVLQENETQSIRNKKKFATEDSGQKLESLGLPTSINLLLFAAKNFISREKLKSLDPDIMLLLQNYSQKFSELSAQYLECIKCEHFLEHYAQFKHRVELEQNLSQLKYQISSESLELLPEYKQRIYVLQYLNFLDEHLVLLPKGHIASCIFDNELLITEIVFENLLGNLSDEAIPAVLSCFILNNKNSEETSKAAIEEIPELNEFINTVMDISLTFGSIEKNMGVVESDSLFLESLNFDTVRPVYEWARGKSFLEIMEYTTLQEGIIVRCIQRVDELINNIRVAAKNLESTEFVEKLERSSKLIRRDIVFIPSLYTTKEFVDVSEDIEEKVETQVDQFDLNELMEKGQDENSVENSIDFFSYNFSENVDDLTMDNELVNDDQYNSNFI